VGQRSTGELLIRLTYVRPEAAVGHSAHRVVFRHIHIGAQKIIRSGFGGIEIQIQCEFYSCALDSCEVLNALTHDGVFMCLCASASACVDEGVRVCVCVCVCVCVLMWVV
jgi:hypothetical protein